jgi:hypothetical protein
MNDRQRLGSAGMMIYRHQGGSSSSILFPGAVAPAATGTAMIRCASAPGQKRPLLPDFMQTDYSLPGNDRININHDCVNTQRMKNVQRHRGKPLYSGNASQWTTSSREHFQRWTVDR